MYNYHFVCIICSSKSIMDNFKHSHKHSIPVDLVLANTVLGGLLPVPLIATKVML